MHTLPIERILDTLDAAAEAFVFPMLDNGYIYPVAARLRAFRSEADWALAFETFGYSPRAWYPDLMLTAIGTGLLEDRKPSDFVDHAAYDTYRAANLWWRQVIRHPIEDEDWIDDLECVEEAGSVTLRGETVPLPSRSGREAVLAQSAVNEANHVANVMRAFAENHRDKLLAQQDDWDVLVAPGSVEILRLEEWRHPDLCEGELPSQSATFRSLAAVLAVGDPSLYRAEAPNTHWSNWPEGGTL